MYRVFCVCIVGKMAQDVIVEMVCKLFLSSLAGFLRVPSLHALVFMENFIVSCSCMIREKRGIKGVQGENAWSINYVLLFTRNSCKFKCFQVKL